MFESFIFTSSHYRLLTTAVVNCCVVANPPKSLVFVFPELKTSLIAALSFDACSVNPKWSNILTVLNKIAVGFATFFPTPSSKVCLAPVTERNVFILVKAKIDFFIEMLYARKNV